MMPRTFVLLTALLVTAAAGCSPRFGPIPDKATAIRVGCAVIHEQYPKGDPRCPSLTAELHGDEWTVYGVLPPGYAGGGPVVVLSKSDGRLLHSYLTQ